MNGVKTETHVRVEQTARGIWYCSSLDVYAQNQFELEIELDNHMKIVEKILQKHNEISIDEKQDEHMMTTNTSH